MQLPEPTTALITMGGQAQVVTFAVDALLAQREPLTAVVVLHPAATEPRVQRALAQLSAEFVGEQYHGHPLTFRHLPLQADGRPLAAIVTDREAEAVWRLARELLAELKRGGGPVHLCIAGGPRLVALTLTSAALLQCDHRDRLWHLYTPREFLEQAREGTILHAPPEVGVRLVPVPIVPWGAYFPALRQLAQPGLSQLLPAAAPEAARCAKVWAELTPAQQETLRVLAAGATPQEAATQLGITLKTVDSHKTKILAECRSVWEWSETKHLTYHFLREQFGPWLRANSEFSIA